MKARHRSLGGRTFQKRKLAEQNPKPRRTFQNSQSKRRSHPEKTREKNEQHLCCCHHTPNPDTNRLGDKQFIRQKLSHQNPKPRGTLQKQPIKKKKSAKNKKRKTGSISCCFSHTKPKTDCQKQQPTNSSHTPSDRDKDARP